MKESKIKGVSGLGSQLAKHGIAPYFFTSNLIMSSYSVSIQEAYSVDENKQ